MTLEFTFKIIVAELTTYRPPMITPIAQGGEGEGGEGGLGDSKEVFSSLNGPTPTFKSIDNRAKIEIVFDKEVTCVDLDYMVNNTTEVDGVIVPVLQVEAMPGYYSSADNLNMTWNATAKTSRSLTLEATFAAYYNVSAGEEPDYMQVIFNDPLLCFAVGGGVIDKKKRLLTKNLPRQLPKGLEGEVFESTVNFVIAGAKAVIVSNFVLNLFITVALQYVLSMINT